MGNNSYEKPEIETLDGVDEAPAKPAKQSPKGAAAPAPAPAAAPTDWKRTIPGDVEEREYKASEMWNSTKDGIDITVSNRIKRNMEYICGRRSFATDKDMETEQLTFINTFMNAVNNTDRDLSHAFMLEMMRQMREDYDTLRDIAYFRFQEMLRQKYPGYDFAPFQMVYTNMVDIAGHWGTRKQYIRGRDYSYLLPYFASQTAKNNIWDFFHRIDVLRLPPAPQA